MGSRVMVRPCTHERERTRMRASARAREHVRTRVIFLGRDALAAACYFRRLRPLDSPLSADGRRPTAVCIACLDSRCGVGHNFSGPFAREPREAVGGRRDLGRGGAVAG